jgi:hypothetical protein
VDVTILGLWLPILVSAVLVWIASAAVWTVMPHRKKEFLPLPDEEAARSALKGLAPGDYHFPHAASMAEVKDPAFVARCIEGPMGYVRIVPSAPPAMGKPMALGFLFYLVVGIVVAYLASRMLPWGAEYLRVFRLTGTVAWAAYFFAAVQDSIWFGKSWSSTAKLCVESLVYGVLTAGAFASMWPE